MSDIEGAIIGIALGIVIVYAINLWTKSIIAKVPQHRINRIFDAWFDVNEDIKK